MCFASGAALVRQQQLSAAFVCCLLYPRCAIPFRHRPRSRRRIYICLYRTQQLPSSQLGGKGETTANSLPIPRTGHSNRWMLPAAVVVASVLATFDAVTRNQTRDLSLVGCGTFLMSSVIVITPGTVFFPIRWSELGLNPRPSAFQPHVFPTPPLVYNAH